MEFDLNRGRGGVAVDRDKILFVDLTSHASLSRTFSLLHTITLSHTHALTRACKHAHTTPLSLTSARGSSNTKSPIPTLCSRKSEQLADTAQRQSYTLQHTQTHTRTLTHTHTPAQTYTHMHKHMHIHIHMYKYIHNQIHTLSHTHTNMLAACYMKLQP